MIKISKNKVENILKEFSGKYLTLLDFQSEIKNISKSTIVNNLIKIRKDALKGFLPIKVIKITQNTKEKVLKRINRPDLQDKYFAVLWAYCWNDTNKV